MRKYTQDKQHTSFKSRGFKRIKPRRLVFGRFGLRLLDRHFMRRRKLRKIYFWINRKFKIKKTKILKLSKQDKWQKTRLFHEVKHENKKISIRYYWLRRYASLKLSRKSRKFRMGKGKGKYVGKAWILTAGTFFIELNTESIAQLNKFFIFLRKKLRARLQVVKPILNTQHRLGKQRHYIYYKPHCTKRFTSKKSLILRNYKYMLEAFTYNSKI